MKLPIRYQVAVLLLLSPILLNGCATWSSSGKATRSDKTSDSTGSFFASAKKSFQSITKGVDHPEPTPWDWATGIPNDVTRSNRVTVRVPSAAIAEFVPDVDVGQVQLVSTGSRPATVDLAAVAGEPVKDFSSLHSMVERSQESGDNVRIQLGSRANAHAADVSPATLRALEHSILPDDATVAVTENANPWVLIKEDGVRCKLMVRAERETGMIHLVIALSVCWGESRTLPGEIRVKCNGMNARCLTAAQALNLLYDDDAERNDSATEQVSFMEVSEQDDYLLPVNYNRLHSEIAEKYRFSMSQPRAALASLPGATYPGPAILGDARALAAFLQQQTVHEPGGEEQYGWLVFDGNDLNEGGKITVSIDLGNGPRLVHFTIPGAGA